MKISVFTLFALIFSLISQASTISLTQKVNAFLGSRAFKVVAGNYDVREIEGPTCVDISQYQALPQKNTIQTSPRGFFHRTESFLDDGTSFVDVENCVYLSAKPNAFLCLQQGANGAWVQNSVQVFDGREVGYNAILTIRSGAGGTLLSNTSLIENIKDSYSCKGPDCKRFWIEFFAGVKSLPCVDVSTVQMTKKK